MAETRRREGDSSSSSFLATNVLIALTGNSIACKVRRVMPPEKHEASAAKPALNLRRNHWLALSLTPGLGATRSRKLVKHFGDVQEIFRASLDRKSVV